MHTCSKFSLDPPQEEELQERILQISDEIKQKHFQETMELCLVQSRQAAAERLDKILRKFDKHSAEGYDVEDIPHLEADLRDLFLQRLKSNFSEAKYGSERSSVFLEALKLRVPQLYTQMMKRLRQNAKNVEQAKRRDERKKVEELKRQT